MAIDRERRDALAAVIDKLLAGHVSWKQYDKLLGAVSTDKSEDAGVREVTYVLRMEEEVILKHPLSAEWRELLSCSQLFLRSDCEYRYAPSPSLAGCLLNLLLLPVNWIRNTSPGRRMNAGADDACWPFYSKEEYRNACGQHSAGENS